MSAAQNISPNRARLWLPLDGQWDEGGIRVGRNLGSAPGSPAYVRYGDGTTAASIPTQRTGTRGVRLDGTDYMRVPMDFGYDSPFTIAILSDSPLAAASWLAATYDSATTRGIRFGTTGSGALVGGMFDSAGGSITVTSANNYVPTDRQKRLYCLSYNGGLTAGGLVMSIDDVQVPVTYGGVGLSSSVSSGRDLLLGARWNAATPTEILAACSILCAAEYPTVLNPYEKRLLKARMMQEINVP